MAAVKDRSKRSKSKFPNRVRFNWGYHDAVQSVRAGWAVPEKNFGFGSAFKVADPENLRDVHPDPAYAVGWVHGYRDAVVGDEKSFSDAAWDFATAAGEVSE